MEEEIKQNPIPVAPSCLCFKKDEFMLNDFSVDKFISEHKKRVQLECLRDDLNVYLNVLKSAMIELINKDYADFVNLSSNLVGLDKAINHLSVPLGQLKEEVLGVKSSVDDAIAIADEKLLKRQALREKKVKLQRIMGLCQRIGQIESALNISKSSTSDHSDLQLTEDQIERMVVEVHQLNFDLNKSTGYPVSEELRPRLDRVTTILQESLEHLFMESVTKEDRASLCRCLRIYAAIDKVSDVELLVRQKIVEPLFDEIITEKNLKSDGLSAIYNNILSKIPHACGKLIDVTSLTKSDESVPGYDFLTNSIWPEVVSHLEEQIPAVFAPGNPNMFHEKYSVSMEFLNQFEQSYSSISRVNYLRQHPSYSAFMSKWNLPVYFQIRYQEIASALESSLQSSNLNFSVDNTFRVEISQILWDCLNMCWSSDVFLTSLANRFWKLSLELLSRFNMWLADVVSKQRKVLLLQTRDEDNEYNNMNSALLKQQLNSSEEKPQESMSIQEIVLLICDIDTLTSKLHIFFMNDIVKKLRLLNIKDVTLFEDAFMVLKTEIGNHPRSFEDLLMSRVVLDCKAHLKMVNDIPRLYRRTNKEVPNKPSGYVTNILKPLQVFLNDHKDTLLSSESAVERITLWKTNVLEKVTEQYLSVTSDVLTSVKKTEDSLKRLKKARERPNATLSGVQGGNNNSLSDDDKIRHQLFLDVENYGHQITLFEVETSNVKSYLNILDLVESARTTPERC